MSQKVKIEREDIISMYMEYVLKFDEAPKSVYYFTDKNDFEEGTFYNFFTSFESLEKEIFKTFFEHTITILNKNESYVEFSTKDKLLSFYYTFIEILTANRSYVLYTLRKQHNPLKKERLLSSLKKEVKQYIKNLEIERIDFKNDNLNKIQNRSVEEFGWGQLMVFINYWEKDESPAFEKTDILIEKTVTASFDLLDIRPIKSVIDLGKFLIKEKLG